MRITRILEFLLFIHFLAYPLLAQTVPQKLDLRLRQIQSLLQQGNTTEARQHLNDAIHEFPTEPTLQNFLGVVEAQSGNYAAAESAFKKALQLSPRYTGAAVNLGRLYQENSTKDPQATTKGIHVYQTILSYDPVSAEAQYQLSVLSLRNGQYLAALTGLSKLPAEFQQNPPAMAVKCAALSGTAQKTQANAIFGQFLIHPQLTADDWILILPILEKQQRLDWIQRGFDTLSNRQLHTPESLRQWGLYLERQNEFNHAREILEKSVTNPISVELLLDLARVAYKQRDLNGALGYLAHARELDPRNFSIHFFFGIICVELELLIDATKSLEKAVSLNPENPYANYALGAVLMQSSDSRKGLPYIEKYCQLLPKDPRGHLALGAAYFQVGEQLLASKELTPLVNIPLTAAGANYYLSRIAKLKGNQEDAYRLIQISLNANPDFSDALVELGQLEIRRKNFTAAGKALQKALELEPDNFLGNMHLLRLYQASNDPRAEEQQKRFDEVAKKRTEKEKSLLRTIEVRPY
jgi:Flp pilus assembly protein TadD